MTHSLQADLLACSQELRETHISLVFLQQDRVYKVKKPAFFGFLDFRTLQARKLACEAELTLNRRLAPSVYRKLVPVCRGQDGIHRFDGQGEVVDFAVEMRRLPDEDAADRRHARGALGHAQVSALGAHLARFHAGARADAETARFGACELIRGNVLENFEQTRSTAPEHLSQSEVAEIEAFQLGFLDRHAELFAERVQQGRVRDGHGDLRLEHVYLGDDGSLEIIDCIEFNDRFRFADVCADIAFLSMDLAWHERTDLAETLLHAYARESQDYGLYRLVDFYESYRAYVRGKVSSFVESDPHASVVVRERAAAQTRKYYLLALACAREAVGKPFVCAVGGLIAAGKSTLAEWLAPELAAPIVDADRTRKHLLQAAPTHTLGDAAFAGAYAPDMTERVYAELYIRAQTVLDSGRPVILDASFRSRAMREQARALAERNGVPFLFVECRAPEAVLQARLRQRARGPSVSDARLPLLETFMASYEPVVELQQREHVVIDTECSSEQQLRVVKAQLALCGG